MKNSFLGIRSNFFRGVTVVSLMLAAALVLVQAGCASVPKTNAEVPRITISQLKSKLDAGASIIVVDTRSLAQYNEVHVTGSVSIPEDEITARSSELKGYDEIVTYCT